MIHKERILAGIVTFNPDFNRLKENINSLLDQVEELVIVDNNSCNHDLIADLRSEKVKVIINESNRGIAFALNQIMNYASINGYEYFITLDQDSISTSNMLEKLLQCFHDKFDENIALVCPYILDRNTREVIQTYEKYTEVKFAITSGSLYKTEIIYKLGGFLESLFIDYVDVELCIRLNLEKYKVFRVNNTVLIHELGHTQIRKIGSIKFYVTNHSPIRRYYKFRNKIIVYKRYFRKFNKWIIGDIGNSIKLIVTIIIFEKDRMKKLIYIGKGLIDGLTNNFKSKLLK